MTPFFGLCGTALLAGGFPEHGPNRPAARRRSFASYLEALAEYPGIDFMPEPEGFFSTRWLTCLTVDPRQFGCDREAIRLHLEPQGIESRPVWKSLYLQPAFAGCRRRGGAVAEALFRDGLCLPSGSSLSDEDRQRVVREIQAVARPGRRTVRSAA